MRAWQDVDQAGAHAQAREKHCCKKTPGAFQRFGVDDRPCNGDNESGEENDAAQPQDIIETRKDHLGQPLVWNARQAGGSV